MKLHELINDVFTKRLAFLMMVTIALSILADFQAHFGFENLTDSYFVLHPFMFLRHLLEALLAALVLPSIVLALYYAFSHEKKVKTFQWLLFATCTILIIFNLIVLKRHMFFPPTPYDL